MISFNILSSLDTIHYGCGGQRDRRTPLDGFYRALRIASCRKNRRSVSTVCSLPCRRVDTAAYRCWLRHSSGPAVWRRSPWAACTGQGRCSSSRSWCTTAPESGLVPGTWTPTRATRPAAAAPGNVLRVLPAVNHHDHHHFLFLLHLIFLNMSVVCVCVCFVLVFYISVLLYFLLFFN